MIGIDLFAGAGGMSLGARAAGIEVTHAVEADPHAARTYSHNHPKTTVIRNDIRAVERLGLPKDGRGRRREMIMFGGPPCQGFSYSNTRTRKTANPSNWLFLEFIRVVREHEPAWVIFENVKGITNTAAGIFLEQVLDQLEKAKYAVAHAVLNAADFGVPQHRERLFVVASRERADVSLPLVLPTSRVSVRDAISDLPKLGNGAACDWLPYRSTSPSEYARPLRGRMRQCSGHLLTENAPYVLRRYRHVPQGGNWEDIPERLMRNYTDRTRCHTGIYHRLRASQPSIVIGNFRKNMLIHPWQDRGLSVREAARIQSFPDSYEFKGTVGFQQQQVGNAVPPLLAAAVFRRVLEMNGTAQGPNTGWARHEQ